MHGLHWLRSYYPTSSSFLALPFLLHFLFALPSPSFFLSMHTPHPSSCCCLYSPLWPPVLLSSLKKLSSARRNKLIYLILNIVEIYFFRSMNLPPTQERRRCLTRSKVRYGTVPLEALNRTETRKFWCYSHAIFWIFSNFHSGLNRTETRK